ncbi:MAG: 50S ribosome-binding GTPase, partial [Burkholderiaceae bacterium]|nr:50S ribosome-binding GTPase [Burkholderiaceae bacterium]
MSPACHVGARKAQPQPIHLYRGEPLVALVGTPNCGKTALFNALTGSRQKVANYAGVTVERKEGLFVAADGRKLRILDLPGIYSLNPRSPDERVTVEVLRGQARGERRPDRVICVVDATNLRRNLRLVLAVKRLGIPCVVALNMVDLAERRGIAIDVPRLAAELGVPVVSTVAVRKDGTQALRAWLQAPVDEWGTAAPQAETSTPLEADHDAVQRILSTLDLDGHLPPTRSDRIDRVVLHPVWGLALLAGVLFLMFQAVFA